MRHPYERLESPYNDYEILEIFFLVTMMKFGAPNMDQKSPISFNEAKEFLSDMISLITNDGGKSDQYQHTLIKGFLYHLFTRDTIPMEFIDWNRFMTKITNQLRNLSNFIRWTLSFKLLVQEPCFLMPGFDRPSNFKEVSNRSGLALLMMSNIYVISTNVIKMVYSSKNEGLKFENLVSKLTEYDGPTYIIIKNSLGEIYGAFKPDKWESRFEKFQGNLDCYIFSFWPKFKNYFIIENDSIEPKTTAYLNISKDSNNCGIGFRFLNL